MSIALHTALLVAVGLTPDRTTGGLDDPEDGSGNAGLFDVGRTVQVSLVSPPAADREDSTDPVNDPGDGGDAATPTPSDSTADTPEPADATAGATTNSDTGSPTNRPEPAAEAASMPPGFAPPIDLAGVLAEMLETAEPGVGDGGDATAAGFLGTAGSGGFGESAAGPGGKGLLDRGLRGAGGASSGYASLFGVSGPGNRVIYVIDRSDSMNGYGSRPWLAAKSELAESLGRLGETQFFQLILYNEQPSPFRGVNAADGIVQMIQGEPGAVTRAQNYLEGAEAFGGTNHYDALRMAIRMRPDVIFFLTDGHVPGLTDRELAEIRRSADQAGTTIHAIEFGTTPQPQPATFLQILANQSRGKYRYFDVTRFTQAGQWQP
jgi:hypothetical protein